MEFTGLKAIYYNKPDAEFKIWGIADQHLTNRAVDWKLIEEDRDSIFKDPYSFWVEVGDYADWHLPSHPYFDAEAFDPKIGVSSLTMYAAMVSGKIVDTYKRIAHKCLGFAYGNHDHNYFIRNNQMDVHEIICKELNVPNLRYSGWIIVYFVYDKDAPKIPKIISLTKPPEKHTAKLQIFVFHGKGAAATPGGRMNALRDITNIVDADLVITAHLHEQLAKPFTRIVPDITGQRARAKTTMSLITGTYLKNYQPDHTGYAEKKALPVTTLGAACARYIPAKKKMIVEIGADNVGESGS